MPLEGYKWCGMSVTCLLPLATQYIPQWEHLNGAYAMWVLCWTVSKYPVLPIGHSCEWGYDPGRHCFQWPVYGVHRQDSTFVEHLNDSKTHQNCTLLQLSKKLHCLPTSMKSKKSCKTSNAYKSVELYCASAIKPSAASTHVVFTVLEPDCMLANT